MLWDVIEESKNGKPFLHSEDQYKNLEEILSRYDKRRIESLEEEWNAKLHSLNNDEFERLHTEEGGIVDSGDDGFYIDFANWIIAQGESLYNEFQENGHKVIIDYIKEHNIDESDYMYESMRYVFHTYDGLGT